MVSPFMTDDYRKMYSWPILCATLAPTWKIIKTSQSDMLVSHSINERGNSQMQGKLSTTEKPNVAQKISLTTIHNQ